MKNKILIASVLVIAFALANDAYAVGQQNSGTEIGIQTQTQEQTQIANQGEDNQTQVQNQEQIQSEDGIGNQVQKQNQEMNQEQNQQLVPEAHRNAVANFVQNLLQFADREEGIGEQVRNIAQQQNQSTDTTVQAMEKIKTRSQVKTFFFGSDYKNLGVLRSETIQTRNRLEQLNRLIENVQNEGDKTGLQNQTQILEQEQVKIENFIKTQESKFSLFGWLTKLFN